MRQMIAEIFTNFVSLKWNEMITYPKKKAITRPARRKHEEENL